MKTKQSTLFLMLIIFISGIPLSYSQNCDFPTAQIDLTANNVRARMLQGGSLWWDGSDGKYIFPDELNGASPVSALFAGGIWIGGIDDGGNLKLSANTYGWSQGQTDFWPGPLSDNGTTDQPTCALWDRFFVVTQVDIASFKADWQDNGILDNPIPLTLLGWPAYGNPFFSATQGFQLPLGKTRLAPFCDNDSDGLYNREAGD